VGGRVGGGPVGGGVGGGVGGAVGAAVAGCVVWQPTPVVAQQNVFCSSDQIASQFTPALQLYSSVEPIPEISQQRRGISSSKLRRQQLVMRQVKSRLGRTVSKSPPQPTYLYVVSWMYTPWPVPTKDKAP